MAGKRILLTVNPHARRGSGAEETARAAFEAAGHSVVVVACERDPERFSALIARHRDEIDVAAIGGGDGTLLAALRGVSEAKVPILLLPLGTTNELARTLRIPMQLPAACALVDVGEALPIDVGVVNGALFVNEASIGLSNRVVSQQTEEVKSRWGLLSIPLATLRAIPAMRHYHLEVDHGGRQTQFRTVQLTVANSYRFGGFAEDDEATLEDGLLSLYSFQIRHWWDGLAVIASVVMKRFPKSSRVTRVRAQRFVVRSRRKHRVFADGEHVSETPATYSVLKDYVEVYRPRGSAQSG